MGVGVSVAVAAASGEGVSTGGWVSVGAGADAAASAASVAATNDWISSSERVGAIVGGGSEDWHAVRYRSSPVARENNRKGEVCPTHTV